MPQYLADIIKPVEDTRSYRALQLDNGLTALLISDPETDISSAALNVNCGSFSDPEDLLGLAQLNKRMLFMGNKKYPIENDFDKFLSQNSGRYFAYTTETFTTYSFRVLPDKLESALDQFSQSFIDPLFASDAITREIEAINSKFVAEGKEDDHWRECRIRKVLADPTHVYYKFSCGNLETLRDIPVSKGLNIRDELVKFNEQHYSANIMYLAVCGKESLDELEAIVTLMFSSIVNRNLEFKTWDYPYKKEQLMQQVSTVPIEDKREMTFTFNFPDDTKLYKCSPGRYISHLIGYKGKGSLLSELKELGLVSNLWSYNHSSDGFGNFYISVKLSEDGLKKIEEVAKNVFQYINLLKQKGLQEYIFREWKDICFIEFNSIKNFIHNVSLFAKKMHDYPVEDLISAPYLLDCYKPEAITQHLEHLIPENCIIMITSKSFQGHTDKTEHFSGAEYKVEPFSENLLASITNVGLNPKHSLPEPNTLIPTEFKIVSDKKDENKSKIPVRIMKNSIRQVWYLQDWIYLEPKVDFCLHLTNPVNHASPHALNCQSLFPKLFKNALSEYLYSARLAGLDFFFYSNDVGYTLKFSGYSHKMAHFVEQILQLLVNYKIDSKRFDIKKEKFERSLRGNDTKYLRCFAHYYKTLLTEEYSVTYEESISVPGELTLEAVQQFWVDFTAQLECDILVYGNINQPDAERLVKIFDEQFLAKYNTKVLPENVHRRHRQVQLPPSSSYLIKVVKEIETSKALLCYYQVGNSPKERPILNVIEQILRKPFSDHCRTEVQLGYSVDSWHEDNCGVQGMSFFIKSDQSGLSAEHLMRRIEAFLVYAKKFIADMSDENFEKEKASLMTETQTKVKHLTHFGWILWCEIEEREYDFDRKEKLVKEIKQLTKTDVLKAFHYYFDSDSPGRRKLTICINGDKPEEKILEPTEETKIESALPEMPLEDPVLIGDHKSFKSSLRYYPVPKPIEWD